MFLVTNCSQCMLCHAVIGEVCQAHFCEVPPKQKMAFWDGQNGI